jgi:hypothetical protein
MNEEAPSAPEAPPRITARHYQALCGLALAAIMLLLFQQAAQSVLEPTLLFFVHVVVLLVGAVGIIYPIRLSPILVYLVRLSPMLVLIGIATPMAAEQHYVNLRFAGAFQTARILDAADMLLCMAGLVFFIGQYRLHGLWFGVLPADARQARGAPGPPTRRSEESLRPAELALLIFTVPAFALSAQLAGILFKVQWSLIDLPAGPTWDWKHLLFVVWAIMLAIFLAAQMFGYWRRLQMDRATALLMLQDMLWSETRGEQRRIQRWLVWKKLRKK